MPPRRCSAGATTRAEVDYLDRLARALGLAEDEARRSRADVLAASDGEGVCAPLIPAAVRATRGSA